MDLNYIQTPLRNQTIEEQIKEMNTEELSRFLFDFFVGFNCESIIGLCDSKPCDACKESCTGCIQEWLLSQQPIKLL